MFRLLRVYAPNLSDSHSKVGNLIHPLELIQTDRNDMKIGQIMTDTKSHNTLYI